MSASLLGRPPLPGSGVETAVSLVIPTIGRPEYLDLAIASALAQVQPFAQVLVFDNSRDQRVREGSRFAQSAGVAWAQSGQMLGALDSWNAAVQACAHEFVCILGDDDLLNPEFHTELQRALARSVMVVCPFDIMDSQGHVTRPFGQVGQDLGAEAFRHGRMADRIKIMVPGICFQRSAFLAQGGFVDSTMPSLLFSDDLLWFRLATLAQTVAMVPCATWRYRVHAAQIGHVFQLKRYCDGLAGYCGQLQRLLVPLGVPPERIFPPDMGESGYRTLLSKVRCRMILNALLGQSPLPWQAVFTLLRELMQAPLPRPVKWATLARCTALLLRRMFTHV